MKFILLGLLLLSCTQKYQTYHVIDKNDFDKDHPNPPITGKLIPYTKSEREHCIGQVLFSSNAQKENEHYLKQMVKGMCPGKEILLNAKLTETWWTTIIYSRSCMKMEVYCPR